MLQLGDDVLSHVCEIESLGDSEGARLICMGSGSPEKGGLSIESMKHSCSTPEIRSAPLRWPCRPASVPCVSLPYLAMQLYIFLYDAEVCAVQLSVDPELFFNKFKTGIVERLRRLHGGGSIEALLEMG